MDRYIVFEHTELRALSKDQHRNLLDIINTLHKDRRDRGVDPFIVYKVVKDGEEEAKIET